MDWTYANWLNRKSIVVRIHFKILPCIFDKGPIITANNVICTGNLAHFPLGCYTCHFIVSAFNQLMVAVRNNCHHEVTFWKEEKHCNINMLVNKFYCQPFRFGGTLLEFCFATLNFHAKFNANKLIKFNQLFFIKKSGRRCVWKIQHLLAI